MARDRSRRTEGSLLLLVILILISGCALVFLARTRDGVPPDAVNVNSASAEELALVLEIDPRLASLLTERRARIGTFSSIRQFAAAPLIFERTNADRVRVSLEKSRLDVNLAGPVELQKTLAIPEIAARRIVAFRDAGRTFARPTDVVHVPIVDDRLVSALGGRLIVRTPITVFWQFGLYSVSIVLLAILVPAFLRTAGVRGDPLLLPLAILLAGLGVMAIFSLSDPLRDTPDYIHQVWGLWMGFGAFLAGALLPSRHSEVRWIPARNNLRRYTYLWALAAMILTIALWKLGAGPEGVRLSLGFFQPVEVIKLLIVLFIAGYLSDRGDLLADALHRWRPPIPRGWLRHIKGINLPRKQDFAPMAVMFGAALSLFLIVRDMGPALLLFAVFISMLYMSTGRSGIVWAGAALVVVGFLLAVKMKIGVVPVRVEMWRSPWENRFPNGMQLGQSLWAMSSGWITGTGLGLGSPETIPRGRDDLVFSVLGEQLGLIGSVGMLVIYCVLIARGLRATVRAQSDFDRLVAGGLTSLLGFQTLLITAGVTGLLPLTGITLPFVSYGNSSLVADFLLLGLLRGISEPDSSVAISGPNPVFRRAVRNLATCFAACLLGFVAIGRLVWIQAVTADQIAGSAVRTPDADKIVRSKINPRLLVMERAIHRGSIYDRKGRVLATSRLDEITEALGSDSATARRSFRKGRYYPHGPAAAHIVGYLDGSIGGPVGIEKEHNGELRGFRSYSDLLDDYRLKDMPSLPFKRKERRGQDVYLTIDISLQEDTMRSLKAAAGALTDARSGRRKDRAAMVMMDPVTGEVLASASIPTFDPNTLTVSKWDSLIASGAAPLFDRARSGGYPPGSSLKIATAAAGLEEGLDPVYNCNHFAKNLHWQYHGRFYGLQKLADDKGDPPHDSIRMPRALRVSCNLYFANLGLTLGPERLHQAFADRFLLRNVKPVDIFAANLATNAFGQGTMVVSPTEMARIAASVADHGRMMQPQYVYKIQDSGGKVTANYAPILMGRPIGELNAAKLAEMLRGVVTDGTARGVFDDLPVQVAGKTGTAQTTQGDREPHSWFIGYTPYSKPQFAFACVIENGGYGKRGAAPAVKSVLRTLFSGGATAN